MTHPSPSLLDAIAEVCKWHGLIQSRHPSRVLRDGGRQEILPPEIPQAIRNGEIPVPEELIDMLKKAALPPYTGAALASHVDELSPVETDWEHPS